MNRRILSAIIAVLGLIVIALAVCSATVWRPSSTAQATLPAKPEQNYVVTRPGVLGLVDSDVTITATAGDADPVFIAVGHSSDVSAWLANDPYVSVTGLTDWDTLEASDVTTRCGDEAEPTTSPAPGGSAEPTVAPSTDANGCTVLEASNADPTSSDLWLTTASGTGSTTLDLNTADPDLVVLAATDGSSPAPDLSMSWPRTVSTPRLVPGLIGGGVLLLIGVFLFLIDIQMRRADQQRRARSAERAARLAQADGVVTAGFPQISDPNRALSRREMREKERAEAAGEEWVDPRTGRVYLDGVEAPDVPQAPASDQAGEYPDMGYNGYSSGYSDDPNGASGETEAFYGAAAPESAAYWTTQGAQDVSPYAPAEQETQTFSNFAYSGYDYGYGDGQVQAGYGDGQGEDRQDETQALSGPAYSESAYSGYGDGDGQAQQEEACSLPARAQNWTVEPQRQSDEQGADDVSDDASTSPDDEEHA